MFQPDRPGGEEVAAGLRPGRPGDRPDKLTAPGIAEEESGTVEAPVDTAEGPPGTVEAPVDIVEGPPGTVEALADTAVGLADTVEEAVAGNMRRSAVAPAVSQPRAGPLGYSPECSQGSRDLAAGPAADSWAGFPTSRG